MAQCPFLTTLGDKVDCFRSCAFYEFEETSGECPFKTISGLSKNNVKNLYDSNYIEEEDEIFVFQGELEKVNYL